MTQLKIWRHKKVLAASMAGILLLTAAAGIALRSKGSGDEDIIWREYPVERGDITASLSSGGVLNATGVHHSFDADLTVERVLVEAGQEVKAGDVLATYSKEKLQEQIDELAGSLETAKQALQEAKNNKTQNALQKELENNQSGQTAQETYEKQKRELENNIRQQERSIEQLQTKLAAYEQELREAEDSQDGSVDSAAVQRLKETLTKLQRELEQLEDRNTQNSSKEQIDAVVRQRAALYNQLNAVNGQINGITANVNRLNQLKQQLTEAGQQLEAVKTKIEGLEPENTQLSELQAEQERLETKIAELQSEINGIPDESAQLSGLVSQRSDLQQQIADLNGQISNLEAAAALAAAIKAKQEQIADLQDQISALSAKEEKLAALREQIRQTQESLETAQYDLETQRLSLETLNSDYEQESQRQQENQNTQNQLDALTAAGLNSAVQNAQAEVDRLREELAQANALLDIPALTAKVDGIVTRVDYTEGENVPAGRSIVTIGDSGEKCVVTQISQTDIGSVEVGQTVEMQFLADPDVTRTGRVAEKSLIPTEGGDGVSYKVTITFDEEQTELMEGMTCSVKFILKRVENVLTLANKVITIQDGRQMVTVQLPDGSREEREIKTGFSDGRVTEIISGLSEGETVVVAG